MKASELRIGNYAIDLDGSIYKIASGADIDGVWKSIPLSEDWLIRFGFECTEQQSWSTGEEVNYKVYKKGDLKYNTIQQSWWLRGIMNNNFPIYVHQLQNLYFALTGSELSIKETV